MTDTGTRTASGAGVTITIDHELCYGTGACARRASDVFVILGDVQAETGKSYVRADVAWDQVDGATVKSAADACPWAAIEVSG
ncbi:ferredoxin [Cryptosporangium aurantiacum]|uniref:Ferredoxin n=1 Tax=Cryptosporangium aurantiacum TaxID=134849 RepID=A0A1M7R3X7_9ACTN|nr:ferredoxin [Cryptosporangium aurantiacum]SHN39739.1 Ferredoxin [Cryptosporangium aurantiacum]